MNISFMEGIEYLNTVNNKLLILRKTKEEKIIQYLVFCNIIKRLVYKMSKSEYITFDDFKENFADKLNSSSERIIVEDALKSDQMNYIKDDYSKIVDKISIKKNKRF